MERREFILFMKSKGLTYARIGKLVRVSRQRIHQIIKGYSSRPPSKRIIDIELGKRLDTNGLGHLEGRDLTREAVRRRDNWTCQICFKVWEEGKRRFDVHHLNGECGKKSRKYDNVYSGEGLITLCHKCHLNLDEVRKKMSDAMIKRYAKK